ncbi:flippase [Natrinema salinisoli]|uniref:flippase n=1 Tax=Natrinema salinisoli TaxID=2878535 RepID=UPI001CF008B1|nr:flippase [Natrinema salinisoli]
MTGKNNNPNTVTDALETVSAGGLLVFGGKVIALGFGFLTQLVMARWLLPPAYGSVILTLAVVSVATMLATLGLDEGMTRKVPEYEEEDAKVYGVVRAGLRIGVISGLVIATGIVIVSEPVAVRLFQNPSLTRLLRIGAVSIPFLVVGKIALNVARGLRSARPYAYIYEILRPTARFVFISGLVLAGFGAVGAVTGQIIALTVTGIGGIVFTYRMLPSWEEVTPDRMARPLLAFSLPLVAMEGMNYLIIHTDTFMIGYYLSSEQVGIYNIAFQLRMALITVIVASGFLLSPVIAHLDVSGKRTELQIVYRVITKWAVFVTLPPFFVLFVFPEPVLGTLFGDGYIDGAISLRVLVLGAVLSVAMGATSQSLIGLEKNRTVLYTTGSAAIVNLVLNALLIPVFGLLGAAIASTSAIVLKNAANLAVLYQNFRIIPLSQGGMRASLMGFLTGSAGYLLIDLGDVSGALVSIVWVMLYPMLILCFHGIGPEDVRFLARVEERTGRTFPLLHRYIDSSE